MAMKRHLVLAMVAGIGLILAGWVGFSAGGDDKPAKENGHGHGPMDKCARACADCMNHCNSCYQHCAHLVVEGKKDHAKTMELCLDCGELCSTAAKLSSRHSPLAGTACEACAKACDTCGAACGKFTSDEHMKSCAKACRDCAKACRDMIKHMDHEKGH
jgi:hypothetical protein